MLEPWQYALLIKPIIKNELDAFYNRIHINDFSSFIRSDFRDDQLFDLSPERAEKNSSQCRDLLERIAAWRQNLRLTAEELIILDMAQDFARYLLSGSAFYWQRFDLTHNTSPLPYVLKRLETYPLETRADWSRYLMLLSQLPVKLRGMLDKLREQQKRGIMLPREQGNITAKLLTGLLPRGDSLLLPHNRPELRRQGFYLPGEKAAAERTLEETALELRRILAWLEGEYREAAVQAKPGLVNMPDGEAYYQSLIKTYTSYHLTPEAIHRIGLEELALTRSRMEEIIRRLGLDYSIRDFAEYLRRERICFDDTPAQLQARFDRTLAAIRLGIGDFFRRFPQARCRAQALPPERENSTSWGYYSVPLGTEKEGVFYYSCAEMDRRTRIQTAAITAHELLPGHHYQLNLLIEDKTLPELCRYHFNTAFADGWAEYAADLAGEMGVYDQYDLFGRYVWDMVLCCRLIVDTGLNALGWSMEMARDFMSTNTYCTEQEIFTETLRYAVDMPGQALAYKWGSLKMQELRRQAQTALAARFDLPAYHEEILRYGSLPLDLLERVVDGFVTASARGPR
jgi:uncharacterized protein (DUF885 family)